MTNAERQFDSHEIPNLQLGELTLVERDWPGKMIKALAVVAKYLHPTYDVQPDTEPGGSKETCLFTSLVVRDFLVEIGFKDATVRGCGVVMRATDQTGAEIHSVGIGIPGDPDRPNKFNGHIVVTVPSLSLLIDTTLYQAIRPAWAGALQGMFACRYQAPFPRLNFGRYPFAASGIELDDREFHIVWLDRPELRWKREIDFTVKSPRRRAVTRALVEAFGRWID